MTEPVTAPTEYEIYAFMFDGFAMSAFACDLHAIPPEERAEHARLLKDLFGSADSVREHSDGYTFVWKCDTAVLPEISAFVAGERRCCPFLRFQIDVAPEGGPISLTLSGEEGAKSIIRAEIGALR